MAILLAAWVERPVVSAQTVQKNSTFLVPWTFREDFRHGIPGWMSYPLAQDVGYDPTIYTKEIAGVPYLVRNVTAYGQHVLHVGIIRPLDFHAHPTSSFNLTYELKMGGRIESVRILLAATDGDLYSSALPDTPRIHKVDVQGKSFDLPASGADIEAVLLESDVQCPDLGSSNRLILRRMEIAAERPEAVALADPKLVTSANEGAWFDAQPIELGEPLVVKAKAPQPLTVHVYESAGDAIPIESQTPENSESSGNIQIRFPHKEQPGLWRAVVSDGHAQTGFRFLMLGEVPPHPRVLLTSQRLQELRKLSGSEPLLAAIRAKAKSLR